MSLTQSPWKGIEYEAATEYQGRSITLYHCTSLRAGVAIFDSQRMKPGTNGSFGGGIYFAVSKEDARRKASDRSSPHDVVLSATVKFARPVKLVHQWPALTLETLRMKGFDSVVTDRFNGLEFVLYETTGISNIRYVEVFVPANETFTLTKNTEILQLKVAGCLNIGPGVSGLAARRVIFC